LLLSKDLNTRSLLNKIHGKSFYSKNEDLPFLRISGWTVILQWLQVEFSISQIFLILFLVDIHSLSDDTLIHEIICKLELVDFVSMAKSCKRWNLLSTDLRIYYKNKKMSPYYIKMLLARDPLGLIVS
jgi:hypothetical protein